MIKPTKLSLVLPAKNILFISYDGMTDSLGQSQVIPYLQGLSKHGYKIFLLSCEKPLAYQEKKDVIQVVLDESSINWFPLSYTKNPPIISTLIDVIKLRNAAKKIHRSYKIDMVHTRPGIPSLVGLWLKKKFGIKFLNDIREFYVDSRVDGGIWKANNFLYRNIYSFFKQQEEEQAKCSDGIVCLTHAAEEIIRQWPSLQPATPLRVIPCSVDLDLFDPGKLTPEAKRSLQIDLGIAEDDFVISYLGSIGGWYLTAEMMQFCKQFLNANANAKFLFISPHLNDYITNTAQQFGIPADRIISVKGRRAEIPLLLSLSKYSLFFIKPCYSKRSSSPTKHGELMAMGIPVITNSGVGDVKEIVQHYKAGFVIDEFTTSAFANVIKQMKETYFDAEAIRDGAIEYYALTKAVTSYVSLYDEILKISELTK